MSFPRYEKYKDSGAEWLGEVPGHWNIQPLKFIVSMKSGEQITASDIDESGLYPVFGGNGLRGYTNQFTHEGEFVLIGRQGALCGNINYAHGKFWASEHAVLVRPKQEVATFWLGELLRLANLGQYSLTAAQPGLSVDVVGNVRIPYPPFSEQQDIATFLDRETAKIDALVAEQQNLIKLLKEKRHAVISHAVTKGLNSGVPMKDSGIEWLGKIPAHWDMKWLGLLCDLIQTGPFGSQLHSEDYVENEIPVINPSNIKDGQIIPDWSCTVGSEIVERLSQHKLLVGDIVFGRRGEMGRCAKVVSKEVGWLCGTGSLNVRLNKRMNSDFVSSYLSTAYVRELLKLESVGSTMDNLNTTILSRIPLPAPPFDEQFDISVFLDGATSELDTLTAEAQHGIELLHERRTALISAAVTGKIDVRNIAPVEAEREVVAA